MNPTMTRKPPLTAPPVLSATAAGPRRAVIKHILRGTDQESVRPALRFGLSSTRALISSAIHCAPLNQGFLVLGLGFALVGIIAARSGRRRPSASPIEKKAAASPLGTVGMFFLGLGIVLVIIGL